MLRLAAVEPRWRPRSNEPVRDHERRLVEAEAGVAAEGDPTVYKPMYDSLYVPLHGNVAHSSECFACSSGWYFWLSPSWVRAASGGYWAWSR